MKAVDIDEDVHDEPEESERVDLKVGEECEFQHIEEVFISRTDFLVE
jgi:hypothetical protein